MDSKFSKISISFAMVLVMLLGAFQPAAAALDLPLAVKPQQGDLPFEVRQDEGHDLSPALKDLIVEPGLQAPQSMIEQTNYLLPKYADLQNLPTQGVDGAVQYSPVGINMPAGGANFEGIPNLAGVAPPDTEGDMGYDPATGAKYYLQWVNLHLQAWNVSDPANPVAMLAAPIPGNAIWSGFGGRCESDNDGDPIVLFDEMAHRWLITQFSVGSTPTYLCIAVSQTADPTGAYYRYAFLYSNTKMPDYPKYGIWPDGYYFTANQFAGQTWAGAAVGVFERERMLVGAPARQVIIDLEKVDNRFGGILPADFEGTPPPAGTPAYFAEVDDSTAFTAANDQLRIWQFHIDWTNPANITFGLANQPNQVLSVTNFTPVAFCGTSGRDCVPQPGTTTRLDALADRLMFRLAYRYFPETGTHRMVANHTVDVGGSRAGIRWYQLERTSGNWSIAQQASYGGPAGDTTGHRWMGSIAMDRMGNIALGYSLSSASVYPSIALVGQTVGATAGTFNQSESIVLPGKLSQTGVNRWGDYSTMSVDPQDGCTFWYTTEYSGGGWDWRTRIVSVRYPSCTDEPQGVLAGTVTDSVSGDPIEGATITAGVYSAQTGANGQYTLPLATGTYTVVVSAFGYTSASAAGVTIDNAVTTTQNFALNLAPLRTVSGIVRDGTIGGHNWPLYARLQIAGFGEVYSDPITGAYSLQLPEGGPYGFTVTALSPGYDVYLENVTVPAGDLVKDFGLTVDTMACAAPGYQANVVFSEGFEGTTGSALPAGWSSTGVQTGGNPAPSWSTNTGTRYPTGYTAHAGTRLVYFNSYLTRENNSARLRRTASVNTSGLNNLNLQFWMFHDSGYPADNDRVGVQVSTNGTTWTAVGDEVVRTAGDGWMEHTVNLNAQTGLAALYTGLLGVSSYGNDVHLDDIRLFTCAPVAGGRVQGTVSDANTVLPLNGALVSSGGDSASSGPSAYYPGIPDGFYTLFRPAGTHTLTASRTGGYTSAAADVTLAADQVIQQDFSLTSGELSLSGLPVSLTLQMNQTGSQTIAYENTGAADAFFRLVEVNAAYQALSPDPNQADAVRHVSPKRLNDTTNPVTNYPVDTRDRSAPVLLPNAGAVLGSWATGLTGPWGVGFDTTANTVWVGSISLAGGTDLDREFTRAGASTGRSISTAAWMSVYAADMAYDPITQRLWQVNVGGDNCIYELDPATGPTGNKICPAFGTSERGLAYDPLTDTFFAGSWNDSLIKRFNRDGVILESVNVNLPISGLAYNPATGHLFVNQSGGTSDIAVLDTFHGYANLGEFNVTGLTTNAGLDMSCDGHLWAVDQTSGTMYEFASDETGACDWGNIPWLSETPSSATLTPSAGQTVTVNFDAAGLLPGTYQAHLRTVEDTPYPGAAIPVTLTVTLQPGYGGLQGTVGGLGVCDAAPAAPLAGATLIVRDASEALVATLTTDSSGNYSWAGPIADGPYTVVVSAPNYISGQAGPLAFTSEVTLTQNYDLRPDLPCITSTPDSLAVTLETNQTSSEAIDLANSGGAGTTFTVLEFPSSGTPGSTPVNFNEGFETTTFPPVNWSLQSTVAGYTWQAPTTWPNTGTRGATVLFDPALRQQDEWLVTPEFVLGTGTLSLWSFGDLYWCRDTNDNCDLNIWLVVGDVGGADDIYVGRADDAWVTSFVYAQSTFNLTPLLPGGPVRIGFQYSGQDGAQIALDDVSLTGTTAEVPWLSQSPANGTLAANGGTQALTIGFDSTGLPVGVYTARIYAVDEPGRFTIVPVTLTVEPPNTAPVCQNVTITTDEDVLGSAAPNCTDAESDPLTYAIASQPAHGTASVVAGQLQYTPALNYNGPDSFTYTANDGTVDSAAALVTVDVTSVNDAPVCQGVALNTEEDTLGTALPDCSDVENDQLTYTISTQPAHGSALEVGGELHYTPESNYNGSDNFTYRGYDGTDFSAQTPVTVSIAAVNDSPSFTAGSNQSVNEDAGPQSVSGWATAISAGPADENGQALDFLVSNDNNALFSAQPSVSPTGDLTYTPAPNANGLATVSVYIHDDGGTAFGGNNTSASQTFTITVGPLNDAPSFTAGSNQTVVEDAGAQSVSGWATVISAGPPDESGQVLNFLVSNDNNGLFSVQPAVSPSGELTYTPAMNAHGSATVFVQIHDDGGTANGGVDISAEQTFTITVSPFNDAPVCQNVAIATNEDVVGSTAPNCTDLDGDPLTFSIATDPARGYADVVADNLSYTPFVNFNGDDSFSYVANDGTSDSAAAVVNVTVTAVNDAPSFTAGPDQSVVEDAGLQTVSGWATAISAGPADEIGQVLNFLVNNDNTALFSVQPAVSPSGELTYTPALNANGLATVSVQIHDDGGVANEGVDTSAVRTFTITITPLNDAPVCSAVTIVTDEDTQVSEPPDCTDVDGDELTFSIASGAAHGSAGVVGDNLAYTPDENYTGPDSFTYQAYDGTAYSTEAQVSVTVEPANDDPLAGNDSDTTLEDTAKDIAVLGNDSDLEGDVLTVTSASNPDNGSTQVNADNTVTYTPDADFNGTDTFTYVISDGQGGTASATVTVTVTAVNDRPSFIVGTNPSAAEDSSAQTVSGWATALSAGPANESGQVLDFIVSNDNNALFSAQPAVGANGDLTYTPAADAHGSATVTIQIHDDGGTMNGGEDTSTAQTFTITVTPVNDAPVCQNVTLNTDEDTVGTTAPNCADVDGDGLTYAVASQPANGAAAVVLDLLQYTPNLNYNGPDSFTYTANDGSVNSAPAAVTVSVGSANDLPTAVNDTAVTAEDTAVAIDVLVNDSDTDGGTLSVVSVTTPAHGTAVIENGQVTYTPSLNYNGPDSFTYTLSDGQGGTAEALVTVTVAPVNDAPVGTADAYETMFMTALTVSPAGVLSNDTDVDGDDLSTVLAANVIHGTLTLNPDGSFTYTPNVGYFGPDSFTYRCSDGTAQSQEITVSIKVKVFNVFLPMVRR